MIMVIASNIMRYMEEKRVTVIDIVLNTSFQGMTLKEYYQKN